MLFVLCSVCLQWVFCVLCASYVDVGVVCVVLVCVLCLVSWWCLLLCLFRSVCVRMCCNVSFACVCCWFVFFCNVVCWGVVFAVLCVLFGLRLFVCIVYVCIVVLV